MHAWFFGIPVAALWLSGLPSCGQSPGQAPASPPASVPAAPPVVVSSQAPPRIPAPPTLETMDTDRSGAVSREEFLSHHAARAADLFKVLDRNGNGTLEAGEMSGRGTAPAPPNAPAAPGIRSAPTPGPSPVAPSPVLRPPVTRPPAQTSPAPRPVPSAPPK